MVFNFLSAQNATSPGSSFQFSLVSMAAESKMASSPDLLSYGFSVIVMLGGVIGYAKAG